jgi:putative MATE family efflux protein
MASEKDLDRLLGDPKVAIRGMVLPFLIAMAVVEANQFIDTFWVSGLGDKAAEAVATMVPIYGMIVWTGVGLSTGATTTMAFRLGKGDRDAAGRIGSNTIIFGVLISIAVSVVLFLCFDLMIDVLGAQDVRSESLGYLLPYLISSPVLILTSIIGGMLRAEGAARKSTVVQSSAALLNMVLDPILIYSFGMGLPGAAIATILASLSGLILGIYWYLSGGTVVKLNRTNFRWDRDMMGEMLAVGGPKTATLLISNITDFLQRIFLIIAGGTAAVMLYNYPWRYIALAMLPGRSLETAMLPVCSAAFGQNDLRKMREGAFYALKISMVIALCMTAIFLFFSEPLMSIMTYEDSMRPFLPKLSWTLAWASLMLPFLAMMGVGSSMLQAMKRAKIPMYFTMVWGVAKLLLYWMASLGWFGVDPYDGIIYSMVFICSLGGVGMFVIAETEFRKLRAASERASGCCRSR